MSIIKASNNVLSTGNSVDWDGGYEFVVLADPQIDITTNSSEWHMDIANFKKALEAVNKLKPRFVIILGDLVQMFHKTNRTYRDGQVHDLKEAIRTTLDPAIPLMVIGGNHDIGDAPTDEDVALYESDFGNCFYSFRDGGVDFLALETSIFVAASSAQETMSKQYEWLDTVLPTVNGKRTLVFSHHPLFIDDAEEGEDMGTVTLDLGSSLMEIPQSYFHVRKIHREQILSRLLAANVRTGFAGHMHLNHGAESQGYLQLVSSSCCFQLGVHGKGANGLTLVKVAPSQEDQDGMEVSYAYLTPEQVTLMQGDVAGDVASKAGLCMRRGAYLSGEELPRKQ